MLIKGLLCAGHSAGCYIATVHRTLLSALLELMLVGIKPATILPTCFSPAVWVLQPSALEQIHLSFLLHSPPFSSLLSLLLHFFLYFFTASPLQDYSVSLGPPCSPIINVQSPPKNSLIHDFTGHIFIFKGTILLGGSSLTMPEIKPNSLLG